LAAFRAAADSMDATAAWRSAALAWESARAAPSSNYGASNQPQKARSPRSRTMMLEEKLTANSGKNS
jgi:hypothetical protein